MFWLVWGVIILGFVLFNLSSPVELRVLYVVIVALASLGWLIWFIRDTDWKGTWKIIKRGLDDKPHHIDPSIGGGHGGGD